MACGQSLRVKLALRGTLVQRVAGAGGAAVTVAAMAKIGLYPPVHARTPAQGVPVAPHEAVENSASAQISLNFLKLETYRGQVGALAVQHGQQEHISVALQCAQHVLT
jgi:hypothetical protein